MKEQDEMLLARVDGRTTIDQQSELPRPATGSSERPRRIQRRRTKGWRMPEDAVYVGRPTKWGNPYPVQCFDSIEQVMDLYSKFLLLTPLGLELLAEAKAELRGKDLACWCPLDQPCHADVLLELANVGREAERAGMNDVVLGRSGQKDAMTDTNSTSGGDGGRSVLEQLKEQIEKLASFSVEVSAYDGSNRRTLITIERAAVLEAFAAVRGKRLNEAASVVEPPTDGIRWDEETQCYVACHTVLTAGRNTDEAAAALASAVQMTARHWPTAASAEPPTTPQLSDAHQWEIARLLNRLRAEETIRDFPLIQALEAALIASSPVQSTPPAQTEDR